MLDNTFAEKKIKIDNELLNKVKKLENILLSAGSLAIGFSGGVDSSFLLAFAQEVLGEVEVQCIAAHDDLLQFKAGGYAGAAFEPLLQRVRNGIEVPCLGGLCRAGEEDQRQG